jgi:magnesium-transporting ATPase (P-type)
LTGEALPQARDDRPGDEEDLLQGRNILLAGTSLVSGQAKALVFATGPHTEFGKIAHLTQAAGEVLSPLQKEIARLSRLVALLSLGLGVLFFAIGRGLGLSFWQDLLFAIGILVANVPEGLLPTVTLALAMGSQRMARKNALIRHLPSVETLGSATVICTDKTGTLTQNRMEVKRLFLSRQFHEPAEVPQRVDLAREHRPFFEAAFLCHTLKEVEQEGRRTVLGDPLEVALVEMAGHALPASAAYPRVDEVPFDSERRRLSTLHRTPAGLVLYTKGPWKRCCRCAAASRSEARSSRSARSYAGSVCTHRKPWRRKGCGFWRSRTEPSPKGMTPRSWRRT